jgi:2-polyprenyl-3-methyl-5-hydroxy-6-metoxy-1,4-benzoquinol methylase
MLEHCPDDVGFLRDLRARIHPGGHLFLTVPAHMDKWDANDDFPGHLQRYERKELQEMIVTGAARYLINCGDPFLTT